MDQLNHHRTGTGEPLVLVHGIGSRWQVWAPILPDLSRHRDVIALDLPGFGASPRWSDQPRSATVATYADQVAAFIADLGLERPHLAGNSLGGGIALELGRRGIARSVTAFAPVGFWHRPGRIWCQCSLTSARNLTKAIAPLLPRLIGSRTGRAVLFGGVYAKPGRLDPAICVEDVAALYGATGFVAARRGFTDARLPGDLGALDGIPVTVAWGSRDIILTCRTQSARARATLPGARHVVLEGCGHVPFSDDPAACTSLLLDTCASG